MEYVSIAFGVLIIAVGLYFLLTPYEKLAAMLPKKKSRRNLRARGWIVLVCGVLLIALQIAMIVMR